MSYISMVEYETSSETVKNEYDGEIEKNGRITNMKRTLLHSVPAFKAYMEWYTLRDEIKSFLNEREVILFSHAISTQNDCLICSTFFRKILIDNGENPDQLEFSEKEKLLVDFGRQIVENPNNISKDIYEGLNKFFNQKEIVLLTAFAGIMIATNTFNNVLRVPLDEYLGDYQMNHKRSDK
ncbi:hypothetical protein [Petroclostridium sp. X23]|uniref:carboxymuconolactone decarboxylase family protein n=1 Tax=Petroclostridium sp. X23 TaxID=3045146 RepID=UPI0024ACE2EE|nr:hypothetical protein [Petroclostridium sp. X23]WHH59976.1 hypothetical protein QKW49_04290 [Petroclostridium sp. X23]